jgi:hypothetical protein
MDIQFITDPEMAPRPREEIEITDLSVTPYPDGRRLHIDIRLTPFAPADRPSLELAAVGPDDAVHGAFSVIEASQHSLSFTMHLRDAQRETPYTIYAKLYYDPDVIQHSTHTTITLPPADSPGT